MAENCRFHAAVRSPLANSHDPAHGSSGIVWLEPRSLNPKHNVVSFTRVSEHYRGVVQFAPILEISVKTNGDTEARPRTTALSPAFPQTKTKAEELSVL